MVEATDYEEFGPVSTLPTKTKVQLGELMQIDTTSPRPRLTAGGRRRSSIYLTFIWRGVQRKVVIE